MRFSDYDDDERYREAADTSLRFFATAFECHPLELETTEYLLVISIKVSSIRVPQASPERT